MKKIFVPLFILVFLSLSSSFASAQEGIITTVAGSGPAAPEPGGYSGDGGPATQARIFNPAGIAIDSTGKLYIGDSENNRVRIIERGIINTFAGTGPSDKAGWGFSGDGGPPWGGRYEHGSY